MTVLQLYASAHSGRRFQFLDHGCLIGVESVPEVPVLLQPESEVGAYTRDSRQSEPGIRRDRPLAPDDLIRPREPYAEPDGER